MGEQRPLRDILRYFLGLGTWGYLAENTHVRRLVEEALFHADHVVHDLPNHDVRPASRRRSRGRTA